MPGAAPASRRSSPCRWWLASRLGSPGHAPAVNAASRPRACTPEAEVSANFSQVSQPHCAVWPANLAGVYPRKQTDSRCAGTCSTVLRADKTDTAGTAWPPTCASTTQATIMTSSALSTSTPAAAPHPRLCDTSASSALQQHIHVSEPCAASSAAEGHSCCLPPSAQRHSTGSPPDLYADGVAGLLHGHGVSNAGGHLRGREGRGRPWALARRMMARNQRCTTLGALVL
jgi:hypothetical protein